MKWWHNPITYFALLSYWLVFVACMRGISLASGEPGRVVGRGGVVREVPLLIWWAGAVFDCAAIAGVFLLVASVIVCVRNRAKRAEAMQPSTDAVEYSSFSFAIWLVVLPWLFLAVMMVSGIAVDVVGRWSR